MPPISPIPHIAKTAGLCTGSKRFGHRAGRLAPGPQDIAAVGLRERGRTDSSEARGLEGFRHDRARAGPFAFVDLGRHPVNPVPSGRRRRAEQLDLSTLYIDLEEVDPTGTA